jgi:hypothetical protein
MAAQEMTLPLLNAGWVSGAPNPQDVTRHDDEAAIARAARIVFG